MSMGKLIKLVFVTTTLASMSAASHAADVPRGPAYGVPPPIPFVYNWTGFYGGVHLGTGWSDGAGGSGLLGGGQVGYNYQIDRHWVLGVEGEFSGTNISDSVTVTGPFGGMTASSGLDWVSTVAVRGGYAFDRWFIYGKVGGAWAHASGSVNIGGFGTISINETVSGSVVGVGAEYALQNNWSAKVEYDSMDFGSGVDRFNVLKAGVNYRFGPGGLF